VTGAAIQILRSAAYLGLQATGHQHGRSFRQAEKAATIRPGSEFIWEIPA
jgi:hypothetical protein